MGRAMVGSNNGQMIGLVRETECAVSFVPIFFMSYFYNLLFHNKKCYSASWERWSHLPRGDSGSTNGDGI